MKESLVLLATHNGGLFISQQLDSIPNSIDIMISDDNSQDNTLEIINNKKKHREISIELNSFGSASKNFSYLINNCSMSYDYYFLSDQDDVWVEFKHDLLNKEIKFLESIYGCEKPILIFGDSIVVDQHLNEISESFFKYDGINPSILNNTLNIFFQNVGQGATFVFNRAFLKLIRPMPEDVYMHDWWLTMYACHFGVLYLSKHKTLYYRQHRNNQIGANKRGLVSQVINNIRGYGKAERHVRLIKKQISTFIKQTSSFNNCKCDILRDFEREYKTIESMSPIKRKIFILKRGVYLSNVKRTLALYFYF